MIEWSGIDIFVNNTLCLKVAQLVVCSNNKVQIKKWNSFILALDLDDVLWISLNSEVTLFEGLKFTNQTGSMHFGREFFGKIDTFTLIDVEQYQPSVLEFASTVASPFSIGLEAIWLFDEPFGSTTYSEPLLEYPGVLDQDTIYRITSDNPFLTRRRVPVFPEVEYTQFNVTYGVQKDVPITIPSSILKAKNELREPPKLIFWMVLPTECTLSIFVDCIYCFNPSNSTRGTGYLEMYFLELSAHDFTRSTSTLSFQVQPSECAGQLIFPSIEFVAPIGVPVDSMPMWQRCPSHNDWICNDEVACTFNLDTIQSPSQISDSMFQCSCPSSFYGSACSIACPTTDGALCSGHGKCSVSSDSAACWCDTGYFGEACSFQCPDNCSSHGQCTLVDASQAPKCLCNTSYYGPTCQYRYS